MDFQSAYSLIVLMEHNKLRVVLPGDTRTYKDRLIASEDIDHDGIIEVGLLEAPKDGSISTPQIFLISPPIINGMEKMA